MTDAVAAEPLIRLGFFAGVLVAVALWEALAPRRVQAIGRVRRWPGNIGVVVVDTIVLRILFPTAAVGFAILAEERGWGLLNAVAWPAWSEVLIASSSSTSSSTCSTCCSIPCLCSGACTGCIMPISNST